MTYRAGNGLRKGLNIVARKDLTRNPSKGSKKASPKAGLKFNGGQRGT